MLKLRRVDEAKTMFEKGWNDLCDFIKDLVSKRGLKMLKRNGDGFILRRGSKPDFDLNISLSLREAGNGVYTLSIDGVDGRTWRLSDNEIKDKKTGKMKVFDKKAQVNNMLDVVIATMDKLVKAKEDEDSKGKDEKEDKDSEEKTECVRRFNRRIRFI